MNLSCYTLIMDCVCKECKSQFISKSRGGAAFCGVYCRNKDTRRRTREKLREYYRVYRKEHRAKINEINKRYRKNNPEKVRAFSSRYSKLPERLRYAREAVKLKRNTNVGFRMATNLRTRVRMALRGVAKSESTQGLLGCSVDFLKIHLQKQFTEGMSWDNYGYSGWHVDHIKPCSRFDLTNPQQQKECFHYTNLQPLWARENIIKSNKI